MSHATQTAVILSLTPILLLGGCFVRMPATRPAAAAGRTGEVAVVERPLFIHSYRDYTGHNREASDRGEPDQFGHESGVPETLQPGTRLEVVGFVSRRLPNGVSYYYVCRPADGGETFDLPQSSDAALRFEATSNDR